MNIIQIVPKLPPNINGLGDYSINLARQLRQDFGIETHFIVCDRAWKGDKTIDRFTISQLSSTSAQALSSLLTKERVNTVLLHYVGYGYAKRGCPAWLIEGLDKWRNGNNQRKLVTMFHEIYASAKTPWKSAFWLSRWQKQLASRLVRTSDRIVTNRQASAQILSAISKTDINSIQINPVFSNIGELKQILPFHQRKKRLVIFGHANSKLQIYHHYLLHVEKICQAFAIEEIYDIGNPTKFNFNSIKQLKIIETGILPAEKIGKILANSLVGFIAFPPLKYLAKSGVLAAYCAHGLFPVIPATSSDDIDGLKANQNYFALSNPQENISWERAELIANRAYQWYQQHNLQQQAKSFAGMFD